MSCYVDTIVKIKIVCKTENCEENEIEMVLFIPINSNKKDPEPQAVLRRINFILLVARLCPSIMEMSKG
jgi:hypothetical protein